MKRTPSERVMIERAIQIVGLPAKTVRAMALRGEIPGAARIGKRWTFDVEGLQGWIAQKENEVQERHAQKLRVSTGVVRPSWR
jgi:hypothetical protein